MRTLVEKNLFFLFLMISLTNKSFKISRYRINYLIWVINQIINQQEESTKTKNEMKITEQVTNTQMKLRNISFCYLLLEKRVIMSSHLKKIDFKSLYKKQPHQ